MEAKLTIHGKTKFDKLLKDQIADLRNAIATKTSKFDGKYKTLFLVTCKLQNNWYGDMPNKGNGMQNSPKLMYTCNLTMPGN